MASSSPAKLDLTLITISFSHFCERGRWALDLARLPYSEVRSLPLLHMPVVAWWQFWAGTQRTRRADKLDRFNSKLSTPMLLGKGPDGKWTLQITDSADIIQVRPFATLDPCTSIHVTSHPW